MLEKVRQGGEAQIVLVILKEPLAHGLPGGKPSFFFRAYRGFESWFSRSIPNALALQDASELLKETPVMHIESEYRQDGEWLDTGGVAQVRQYGLDILLQTGFTRPRGEIVKTARLGAWYYDPGEEDCHEGEVVVPGRNCALRNNPPGFWEVFEGRPVTPLGLYQALDDKAPVRLLYQSYAATDLLSVNGTCNRVLWKSASFVPLRLKPPAACVRNPGRDDPPDRHYRGYPDGNFREVVPGRPPSAQLAALHHKPVCQAGFSYPMALILRFLRGVRFPGPGWLPNGGRSPRLNLPALKGYRLPGRPSGPIHLWFTGMAFITSFLKSLSIRRTRPTFQ